MKRLVWLVLLAVLAVGAYHYRSDLQSLWASSNLNANFLPPPLRATLEARNAYLTVDGVIEQTNLHRNKNGLLSLTENSQLNQAAQIKLDDMFKNQYFEHDSPSGAGPSDLAKEAGYQYIVVGENLALGNFENDQALVQGWMDSPGHRANILHKRFQDIGVAVGRGTFEGKTTWLAVQEFGEPLSACPQPSKQLKSNIDAERIRLTALQADMARLKNELESGRYRDREQYNQKVEEYNSMVAQANSMINQIKELVTLYNAEVNQFNSCVSGS